MPFTEKELQTLVQMKIARRFRWGLMKSRPQTEIIFESLLTELNLKFVPQAIFLDENTFYIVDFWLKPPHSLVIEIDGINHESKKKQIARDKEQKLFFENKNLKLLRINNQDILESPEKIRTVISHCLSPSFAAPKE